MPWLVSEDDGHRKNSKSWLVKLKVITKFLCGKIIIKKIQKINDLSFTFYIILNIVNNICT